MSSDPFHCPGCHTGDLSDFDHFCDALDVQTHELPQAFAAWLARALNWTGEDGPL